MRCSKCDADNRETARFCASCGARFTPRCSSCGAEVPAGARFCDSCGTALNESASAVQGGSAPQTVSSAGERRHLTVLFCDLVGSTAIAAQLDPEEWREIIASYHRVTAEAIKRFGGHVAQYLGDGVIAYFGYPQAHDNDAERAARAALAILDAIQTLNAQTEQAKLSARVGIHSGAVVVGASAGNEADVFGDTPNLAARVQAAAEPDSAIITAETHRLISGLFLVEDRGTHQLKGIERPVQLYRLVRQSGARGRLEAAAAAHGLTPFVGREDELRLLMNRWERVCRGEGQLVLISGEAGIGKSRLIQRFREEITGTSHIWLEGAAEPFHQNTPFYPVAEVLWQLVWEQSLNRFGDYLSRLQSLAEQLPGHHDSSSANSDPQAGNEEQLADLRSGLMSAGLTPGEVIPLIAPLLNLRLGAGYSPSSLPPEEQRRRLLATLVQWLSGVAQSNPLVMAIEDLHWTDPSTLELIQLLGEQGATVPLLVLCTARPEFHPEWPLRSHHLQLTLNRLSAGNVRAMMAQVAAQKALADETVSVLVERTGGVPLFVEELTRAVLESGVGNAHREIPATLHDSLMARLDRLGEAKEVAQIAAVIGRDFSYQLLKAVHPVDDHEFQSALNKLAEADLIHRRGIPPEATYQFKHALIQDTAYDALLRSRRRDLHLRVARTIEEQFPAIKDTHPEMLARHWEGAGETERAIAQWSSAAQAARFRSAFKEALDSYQRALELVRRLPESPRRRGQELRLGNAVYSMRSLTDGYAAPETVIAIDRLIEMAEKANDRLALEGALRARCLAAYIAGDLHAAATFGERGLTIADQAGFALGIVSWHTLHLMIQSALGNLAAAEQHFIAGQPYYDLPEYRSHPSGGIVACFGRAARIAWITGYGDVARQRLAAMTAAAVESNNLYFQAFADCETGTHLLSCTHDYRKAEECAVRGLEVSDSIAAPQIAAYSRYLLGWARASLGRFSEGITLIRQANEEMIKLGDRTGLLGNKVVLAEALQASGATNEAMETIEQALQMNPEERFYLPEALRIRGQLYLNTGLSELAEQDFYESIKLAEQMEAKVWELRSKMSLARLLASRGCRDEAREKLVGIYSWFTEGFDTADLKDARKLLDELSAP
jgi:predicted ATPase/class 3 adenylate cyclase